MDKFTTPPGIAGLCFVERPSKYDKYTLDLYFEADDKKFLALKEELDRLTEEAVAGFLGKARSAKERKALESYKINSPVVPEEDEDGEETGRWRLRLTSVTSFERDGKVEQVKIPLVDANNKPIHGETSLGRGSKLRAAFKVKPYKVVGSKSMGLSCYLNMVKILQLVSYGGDASTTFGDDEIEDGFDGASLKGSDTSPFELDTSYEEELATDGTDF